MALPQPLMLSYVIITRNRCDDLRECLASVASQTYRPCETIVVDNASTDGTGEMVCNLFPSFRYIRLPENRGVPGARNEGIRASRGDIIVLLDDDAVFADSGVGRRIARAFEQDPRLGILAAKIVHFATGRLRRQDFPALRKRGGEAPFETTYFIGAGAALRRDLLRQVGLFPEDWMFAAEELDLCFRVMETEYRIEYRPEVVVRHKASLVERPASRRFYHQVRNRMWLVTRHLPLPIAVAHFCLWAARMTGWSLVRGQPLAVLRGLRDGVRGLPRAWRERRVLSYSALQRLRRLRGRLWY